MVRQQNEARGSKELRAQAAFTAALKELKAKAELSDNGRIIRYGRQQFPPVLFTPQTLSDWFTGRSVPSDSRKFKVLIKYLQDQALKNSGRQPTDLRRWEQLRLRARQERRQQRKATQGRPEALPHNGPDRPSGGLLRRMVGGPSRVPLLDEVECALYVQAILQTPEYRVQAVTYVDVDGLLAINAVYGDQVGDLVLDECGDLIRRYYEDRGGSVCRLRGDQFVVAQTGFAGLEAESHAVKVAQLIRRHDWSTISPGLFVSVAVSAAIRSARSDGRWYDDVPTVILRAILGVKEAKRLGTDVTFAPRALPRLSGTERQRWERRLGQIAKYLSD